MLFENHDFQVKNYFRIDSNKNDPGFSISSHRTFEFYAVTRGCATAIVNGVEYTLLPGEAVLVFPFQRHEYRTTPGTDTFLCIFSHDLVGSFYKGMRFLPTSNKFKFEVYDVEHTENLFVQKAFCYDICANFDITAEYIDREISQSGTEEVVLKMLLYISDNYKTSCSLKEVSNHLGYDYRYISKLFKKIIGTPYVNYVNAIRVYEACRLILYGNTSLQDVATNCGFGCMRSFNRVFKEMVGKTPREYMRLKKRSCNPPVL